MAPQSPRHFQQDPPGCQWDLKADFDSFNHTKTTSTIFSSRGQIYQPQPVRPIGGSMAWGKDRHALARPDESRTYHDEESFGATYFPGPENTLGLFSTDPKYSAAVGSPGGPSRRLPPTPPRRRQIGDYDIEGGWSFDATGKTHYVPHGNIKEVDCEEDLGVVGDDSCTCLDEPLPPETTPPPRPKQRSIELIPLSILEHLPLGDIEPNTRIEAPPSSFNDFSFGFHDLPTICSSSTIVTQSQELETVDRILGSIMTASLDVISLHAKFGALPTPNAADRALCDKIATALHAVQKSLRDHRVVPPEQWGQRSVSCCRKYDQRLMSLQRTLRRLHVLSSISPRINQVNRLRKLLEQYIAKLSDLAAKFNAMLDRVRDRHINTILIGILVDFEHRVDARKQERKTARAARIGQYDYAFHRQGRRPSMVQAS
ncbi:hypothetical protein C8R47DRAFT_1196359 [Mycena vitilis]|nr:hypothetical protein C8R47DRAFT_1196359 [Mycena vitilis]